MRGSRVRLTWSINVCSTPNSGKKADIVFRRFGPEAVMRRTYSSFTFVDRMTRRSTGLATCRKGSMDLVRRDRCLHLLKGKLDFAAHTFYRKHEINHASELVRNEITYEIDAVAGLDLRCHRGAAKLAPD